MMPRRLIQLTNIDELLERIRSCHHQREPIAVTCADIALTNDRNKLRDDVDQLRWESVFGTTAQYLDRE